MDFHKFSKEHNHEMIAFETEENSKSLETDKSPQIFTTESFSPNKMSMFSHDYQENPLSKSIKSRTICDNILVCLIFVGILSMFVSLVYVFDLDKNANKFLIIMICSSISIALELFFIVGIDFLDHFGREINMCSLLFAELINISCLIFFAAKAQSAFFTIIFFISQVFLLFLFIFAYFSIKIRFCSILVSSKPD